MMKNRPTVRKMLREMIVSFIPYAPEVTPEYIKEIKERYGVSWAQLNRACGYEPRGSTLQHAVSHPETYLTDLMKLRFKRGVIRLEKELGQTYAVILGEKVDKLPRVIRFTKPLAACKGHNEMCTVLSDSGYCDRLQECMKLAKEKAERKAKRGK